MLRAKLALSGLATAAALAACGGGGDGDQKTQDYDAQRAAVLTAMKPMNILDEARPGIADAVVQVRRDADAGRDVQVAAKGFGSAFGADFPKGRFGSIDTLAQQFEEIATAGKLPKAACAPAADELVVVVGRLQRAEQIETNAVRRAKAELGPFCEQYSPAA